MVDTIRQRGKYCLLPSLALNFAVIYSSPGNLALFLLADALGQPDRLRGAADQDQELLHSNEAEIFLCTLGS